MNSTATEGSKMEFYFTRKKIDSLLEKHPDAKGIIIRQEIKVRHTSEKETINVVEITAYADGDTKNKTALSFSIQGCPIPPGCNDDE